MTSHPPIRLGFARGVAPNTWARRWTAARPGSPLELVPVDVAYGAAPAAALDAPVDVMIERTLPGRRPEQDEVAPRHAMHLYTEQTALVLPRDHELAEETGIPVADLALITLLAHPDHPPEWGAPHPWADPALAPKHVPAALDLVAAGLGGMLLPLPLARHLTRKREHAILTLIGDPALPGAGVWATWSVARDAEDVQQLAGVLRGRTARSARAERETADPEPPRASAPTRKPKPASKKAGPPPGSRGAQLAAAKRRKRR